MNHDNLTDVCFDMLIQANGWQAQYRLIIQWGTLITFKSALRQEKHLIKGCETSAWLAHDLQNDRHQFFFDSDSRVINGLVAIFLSTINKKKTGELAQLNFQSTLLNLGLEKYIRPSRSNGLKAIVSRAYELAECVYLAD